MPDSRSRGRGRRSGAAIVETCFNGDREPFRQQLIAAIAAEPERPSWDSWTVALLHLVVEAGLIGQLAIERHLEPNGRR